MVQTTKKSKIVADIQLPNTKPTTNILPKLKVARYSDPPFPLDVYPLSIQQLLKEMQEKQGLSLDYAGTALLSFIGAAVGAKVRLEVAGEWIAPLCVWTCIIGDSGTRKSPIFRFFKKPFMRIEEQYQREYEILKNSYETDLRDYNKDREGKTAPKPPKRKDLLIETTTTESIKSVLGDNHHGVCVVRDELLGLLNSFGQYKGKGDDQQSWIEFFDGDGTKRNLASKETMFVSFSNVCITGGTQPARLPEFVGKGRDDDGFIYRILFTYPSGLKKPTNIFKEGISNDMKSFYSLLIHNLHGIGWAENMYSEETATVVKWCNDGFGFFEGWYGRNAQLFNETKESSERGVMSKLEGYLPRLALLLEILERQCADMKTPLNPSEICVTKKSCEGAEKLVEYFKYMASKMQRYLHNNPYDNGKIKQSSGINWLEIFKGDIELRADELKNRIVQAKGIGHRTAHNIINAELYKIRTGYYSYLEPVSDED